MFPLITCNRIGLSIPTFLSTRLLSLITCNRIGLPISTFLSTSPATWFCGLLSSYFKCFCSSFNAFQYYPSLPHTFFYELYVVFFNTFMRNCSFTFHSFNTFSISWWKLFCLSPWKFLLLHHLDVGSRSRILYLAGAAHHVHFDISVLSFVVRICITLVYLDLYSCRIIFAFIFHWLQFITIICLENTVYFYCIHSNVH